MDRTCGAAIRVFMVGALVGILVGGGVSWASRATEVVPSGSRLQVLSRPPISSGSPNSVVARPPPNLANVPGIEWLVKLKKRGGIGRGLFQFATPLVVGDRLYVGTAGGRVVCIDRQHGERLWDREVEGPVVAPIRFADGQLFFGDAKGIVYAAAAVDGTVLWRSELGAEIMVAPLVRDAVIYVTTMHGELVAVDRSTGARKWRTPRRMGSAPFTVKGASSPVWIDGRIIAGYADGTVVAHDPATGAPVWEQQLVSPAAVLQDVDTTPLPVGHLLIAATVEGGMVGLDPRSGRIVWKSDLGTANEMVSEQGVLYVAGAGRVSAVDATTGAVRWKTRLPVEETSGPAIVGNKLVFVSVTDQVFLVDRGDGTFLGKRHLGSGSYGHPVAEGDRVYVVTNGGHVVALRVP